MGLFEENERSALVIAKEQCDVAEIQYSKFRELVKTDPDILMHMAGQLAKRLRDTSQKVKELQQQGLISAHGKTIVVYGARQFLWLIHS